MLLAGLVFLLAGAVAPFINAARFGGSIRGALEASLGRKVTFEKAYFTIFSGPGFSLENVTIAEDPRYGIEPFAYVPVLEARIRLDKLLFGRVRFTSLRLLNPSLNLVKRADGTWNVVALMQRLTAPRKLPMNLFPSFEVSQGRIDFKFGTRKTILYISESDLSVYPQRSGKIYLRFSGSPARTDRAGMGFGHFRGDLTWLLGEAADRSQVEAQVFLDSSNLSELTTLVEGHDIGVHGTVSSRLYLTGPAEALNVTGDLELNEVHRWDLVPASGEAWTVRYGGRLDLLAHTLELRTMPAKSGAAEAVSMRLRVSNFLARPSASVMADLKNVPLPNLFALASRMGVVLPAEAALRGEVNGAVSYSNVAGWSGGLALIHAEAAVPGAPPLRAETVQATIRGDQVHFEPAPLTGGKGSMLLSGDYNFVNQHVSASLATVDASLAELAPLADSWLGGLGSLAALKSGEVTGQFQYVRNPEPAWKPVRPGGASWSGQFTLSNGALEIPDLPLPLANVRAHASFHDASFEWDHLTATLGGQTVRASYRFNPLGKHAEHARVEFAAADLSQLEQAFSSRGRPAGFWARLRFGRALPAWLLRRDLEGELVVDHLSADARTLGGLNAHILWQGANIAVSNCSLRLPQGLVSGSGALDLAGTQPRWEFAAEASGFQWSGGQLNATGQFSTSGSGQDLVRNLTATGTFTGQDLTISSNETFAQVSGQFQFSFASGWPDLRLSGIEAEREGEQWSGDGLSQPDGKLLLNLADEDRELHLVSSFNGEGPLSPVSEAPGNTRAVGFSPSGLKSR